MGRFKKFFTAVEVVVVALAVVAFWAAYTQVSLPYGWMGFAMFALILSAGLIVLLRMLQRVLGR